MNDDGESSPAPLRERLTNRARTRSEAISQNLRATARDLAEAARGMRARFLSQEVTVYPTHGYRLPESSHVWRVPVRVWVHDNRDTPFVEEMIGAWAARYFARDLQRPLDDVEKARLVTSLGPFIADDKQNEAVDLQFGAESVSFPLQQRTSANGVIEETVDLPGDLVARLIATAPRDDPWCPLHARTRDGNGAGIGAVRFLPPEGLSVVSDIDDTVKITHVPAGKAAILRNTFLRKFRAAEGMRERYRGIAAQAAAGEDVCFHYVSGGPWQLFTPLHKFLIEQEQFPRGTFHMKNLRKNILERGALRTVADFAVAGDLATLDQKIRQITALMIHFPRRKFILVGDSGEKDPEVYRAIRKLFPDQVIRILIRDVLSERLAGMERITGNDVPVAFDTTELEQEMEQLVAASRARATQSEKL